MEDPNVYRELGELSAKVEALQDGHTTLREEMKAETTAINTKLDLLLQRDAKASGARGMLWKVGGASSAGTGLLLAIAQWWVETFGGKGGHP